MTFNKSSNVKFEIIIVGIIEEVELLQVGYCPSCLLRNLLNVCVAASMAISDGIKSRPIVV